MSTPLRILIVEDVEDDMMLLLRALRHAGFETEHHQVQSAAEMKQALQSSDWDLICADYSLPQFNVPDALEIVRESGKDIPFIVISGSIGEDRAVEMLREGAHDFIIKGSWARLGPAVQRELREAAIRRERQDAERTIHLRNRQLTILSRRLVEAQEEERRQIARDLHDEIGSLLTALKFALQQIEVCPGSGSEIPRQTALKTVNDLIDKIRQMSLNLRPPMLDDLGLIPTLLWHFERFTQETGIRVHFNHNMTERPHPRKEAAAYRIIQESLTNVARYAQADEVYVTVEAEREGIYLEVMDRGAGFDPAAVRAAARTAGISGMVERASLLGGELSVQSAPGEGTQVIARLPFATSRNGGRSA